MHVVTLLPSATEIVAALGVDPVGTSHECDHPPGVADGPDITSTRIDAAASSESIDQQVAQADSGDGVYEIDADLLERLDPDLIVTQGICDVCAVDTVLVERVVEELDLDAEVLTTDPHHLEDLYEDVERIGAALGRDEAADELIAEFRDRVSAVEAAVGPIEERPSVAILDWMDPVMVAGHWMPELVEIAGGQYPLAEPGDRSTPREWDLVLEADPDVLVAAPCGFDLDQTRSNLGDLADRDGWSGLRAVRAGRSYAMDGHHYVNRPGPRLIDTLEHLAATLHPGRFDVPPADVVRPMSELIAPNRL
ncbi:periplasmic binding protein [Salinarchaeum sp. Harcht-Bsk1]|uniref:ABC transporter substrate-binding protein n=1 Tax=Salinarchaeum sp. Harcht-Bsk1 TaxID=1333523 RepID=UPI0003422F56|nr:ABC transporter substrate-binding protein [Salinarchaeum sp. Harcht-Bsk1]AGN02787.1 periplasmic binding protein [Salinarchaeum sp. Harcht-Bsk1]